MKKHSMWIILGAILLIEIIVYFVVVSPQGSVIDEKTEKLELTLKRLGKYVRMSNKIPHMDAVRQLKENRKTLADEHKKCLDFYNGLDKQFIKKWFPELGVTDWKMQPTPAQFQSLYRDKFRGLRERCKEKNILINQKDVLKLSSDENMIVTDYRRRAAPPQPADVQPEDLMGGGFWETNQLNAQNLRTAQMQYWIQEAFVDALIYAEGKQLVYVSFFKDANPPALPEGAVTEYFDHIPVIVLARMPYGSIARMLQALANSRINMDFRGVKVIKPVLQKVATNPHADIKQGIEYAQQEINGVFPRVMDKNSGVDFGQQPNAKRNTLPGQDELISEPPVLVEFSYYVMSVKPEK